MKKLTLWETGSACIGVVIAVFVLVAAPYAKQRVEDPLAAEDWKEVREKVAELAQFSEIVYFVRTYFVHGKLPRHKTFAKQ